MNTLMFDLTDFCKEMSIKNFRNYSGLWERDIQRSATYRELNKKENLQKFNDRLELKIKELIKFKKRAEKLLNE